MKKLILASFMAAFILPSAVFAQNGERLFVQSTSTGADAYAAGQSIRISEAIAGDFYGAGQDIRIEADIGQDLGLAGQIIHIQAEVGDDIRAGGQLITITDKVGDSITAAGQSITLREGAETGGDVWASAESIELNASIHGNVRLYASRIKINAQIDGDADITAGEITFGKQGFIAGNLKLKSSKPVPGEKVGGEIDFTERKIEVDWKSQEPYWQREIRKLWSFTSLLFLLGTLAIGAGLLFLAENYFRKSATDIRRSPFVSLGVGFLMLFGVPVLSLILMATIIGLPIGGALLLFYFALLLFAGIIQGLVVGAFLYPVEKRSSFWHLYGSFALGTFVIFLLPLIPYLGGILRMLIFLTAFGSLGREAFFLADFLRKEKKI